jgi:hypothetical protein
MLLDAADSLRLVEREFVKRARRAREEVARV